MHFGNFLGLGLLSPQLPGHTRAYDLYAPVILVDTWVLTRLGHIDAELRSLQVSILVLWEEHGHGASQN